MSEKFFYSKREFLRFSAIKEKFLEEDIERGKKAWGIMVIPYETLNNTIFRLLFQQEDDKKCMDTRV